MLLYGQLFMRLIVPSPSVKSQVPWLHDRDGAGIGLSETALTKPFLRAAASPRTTGP